MKVKGLIIIFLINSSFFVSAQTEIKEIKFNRYYWEKYDGLEFELWGDIRMYEGTKKSFNSAFLSNTAEDFELSIKVWENENYNLMRSDHVEKNKFNILSYIREYAMENNWESGHLYKKHNRESFYKINKLLEFNSEFCYGYSYDEQKPVIFGLIDDLVNKRLYEIELIIMRNDYRNKSWALRPFYDSIVKSFDLDVFKNQNPGSVAELPFVKIGDQIWMSQNLNVTHFRNGDIIPEARTKKEWIEMGRQQKPAWCFYENDSTNNKILGRLYNYYAVSDPRGLAPNGWKIPQKGDFNFYRKKPEEFRSKTGWLKGQTNGKKRCSNCANWSKEYKRKVPCHVCKDTRQINVPKKWISGNGNNFSGFNAFPTGYRNSEGQFVGKGDIASFWILFAEKDYVRIPVDLVTGLDSKIDLDYQRISEISAIKHSTFKNSPLEGLSIRCIKVK